MANVTPSPVENCNRPPWNHKERERPFSSLEGRVVLDNVPSAPEKPRRKLEFEEFIYDGNSKIRGAVGSLF